MVRQYQSFPDVDGGSDSAAKLAHLRLPKDLDGQSLLDVACNEGFFCQEAWRRGANRVVGIDKNRQFLKRARERDERTEYHHMNWEDVTTLDERFDVILLLSALHYATNPRRLLRDLYRLLKPSGILILECGVGAGTEPRWVRVERPAGDVVRHPTAAMIEATFPAGAVRGVGPSVEQRGDPAPRSVFHIARRKPIVMLVGGNSGAGKSTLAGALRSDSVRVVRLDLVLGTIPKWCTDPRLVELASGFGRARAGPIAKLIAEEGVEDLFADAVLAADQIPIDAQTVTVVEGYVLSCGRTAESFEERLRERGAYVWHVRPSDGAGSDGAGS